MLKLTIYKELSLSVYPSLTLYLSNSEKAISDTLQPSDQYGIIPNWFEVSGPENNNTDWIICHALQFSH